MDTLQDLLRLFYFNMCLKSRNLRGYTPVAVHASACVLTLELHTPELDQSAHSFLSLTSLPLFDTCKIPAIHMGKRKNCVNAHMSNLGACLHPSKKQKTSTGQPTTSAHAHNSFDTTNIHYTYEIHLPKNRQLLL
jgi:hypothetical protein